MARTSDPVALNDWYPVESSADLGPAPRRTRLLGQDITLHRRADGQVDIRAVLDDGGLGPSLPVIERYGGVFTSLGTPARDLVRIAEAEEPDRREVICGWFTIRASGLRIVENFLDVGHFPFVHTDILGAEPRTEVAPYRAEIRRDVDEVWALNCRFWQPRAAASETDSTGVLMDTTYRVPAPFIVMLYRVAPSAPNRRDVIALFIQPIEADFCRALPVEYLVDEKSSHAGALHFQQVIFLQDRMILENQRPLTLPLDPRAEIPTRADLSAVTYRRWLAEKGLRFGTTEGEGATAP